jgi:hypothetical protein
MIQFNLKEILDPYVQESLKKLDKFLRDNLFAQSTFKLIKITVSSDNAHYRFKHNLGFKPTDLIPTFTKGTGTVVWNYALFDSEFLDLTFTGTDPKDPLTVRAFAGSFEENP